MVYQAEHYSVLSRNLWEVASELLVEHADTIEWHATQRSDEQGQRVYGELHECDWWAQQGPRKILCLLAATDATCVTGMGAGRSMHPVYLTLGNLPLDVRLEYQGHARNSLSV